MYTVRMIDEQYLIDKKGVKTAVLIEIEQYRKLLEAQEELEAIHAFDDAIASKDEAIPFEQAIY
jgi:hypothetical protein